MCNVTQTVGLEIRRATAFLVMASYKRAFRSLVLAILHLAPVREMLAHTSALVIENEHC